MGNGLKLPVGKDAGDALGIVIELKYAENGDMDAACKAALKQIEEKDYIARLKQDGMRNFIRYGIACFKKDCRVAVEQNPEI